MSERKVEINLDPTASASDQISEQERIQNEMFAGTLSKIEMKARIAEVLDRGVVGDRLFVDLPPDMDGQWVPRDQQAMFRMEALGYQVDTKWAPARRLHDKGDGASHVGDVVFMVAPKIIREVIDEVKRDRYNRIHAPKGGKQKEEKDFEAQNQQVAGAGISSIVGSKVDQVTNLQQIKDIIDPK